MYEVKYMGYGEWIHHAFFESYQIAKAVVSALKEKYPTCENIKVSGVVSINSFEEYEDKCGFKIALYEQYELRRNLRGRIFTYPNVVKKEKK